LSLVENHRENCEQNQAQQHNYVTGWRTLWAAVWLYTQDIYWSIPGHVLDFCERWVSCHSHKSNEYIAAVFGYFHVWTRLLFLRSIKKEDKNRLISVEDELYVCLPKVQPSLMHLCSKKSSIGFTLKKCISFFISVSKITLSKATACSCKTITKSTYLAWP
jgi:hypothetical protein